MLLVRSSRAVRLLRADRAAGCLDSARRAAGDTGRRASLRAGSFRSERLAVPPVVPCGRCPSRPAAASANATPAARRRRCARHPTTRPGAARCGQAGQRLHVAPATRGDRDAADRGQALRHCVHTARRAERDAGCLAERGAVRRAWHSSGCGGPTRSLAGRHDRAESRRAHSESCRPARSAPDPVTPAARRAESRYPAARSARRRLSSRNIPLIFALASSPNRLSGSRCPTPSAAA